MANASSAKGNPASHRMSNPKNKALRAKCYENGLKRKSERRIANETSRIKNEKLRSEGKLTPRQKAQAKRFQSRTEKHIQFAMKHDAVDFTESPKAYLYENV